MATLDCKTGAVSGRRTWLSASVGICLLFATAGCSDDQWLREDYFGKSWLEPEKFVQPVKRDAYGNAVLPEKKKD
jgi:hypothetical protein